MGVFSELGVIKGIGVAGCGHFFLFGKINSLLPLPPPEGDRTASSSMGILLHKITPLAILLPAALRELVVHDVGVGIYDLGF